MSRTAKTRVFLPSRAAVGERVELSPEEARHIFKVLRAREGEILEVVDGDRRLLLAEAHGDARHAEVEIVEEISPARGQRFRVTLYQAVPKGKHMDLVVEKATELGVERIVPLLTEHGEVGPGGEKVARWRRLAEAAARQSLQLRIPEIADPVGFREAVEDLGDPGVVLHNETGLPFLEEAITGDVAVGLFVGPEGGWSGEELRRARESGMEAAQMGPYRLRAETAGVVAVARAEARLRSLAGGGTREGEA